MPRAEHRLSFAVRTPSVALSDQHGEECMLSSAERQRLRELEAIPSHRRSPSETAELLHLRSRDFGDQAGFVGRDPGMPDDDDQRTGIGRDPSLPEDK
jgi:hypothetical protein